MSYENIIIESISGVQEHIMVTHDDGSMESFPVDEKNPRYIQFLEEIA